MKIIKNIFKTILVIVAIWLVAALFISKEYNVERSMMISMPTVKVFEYVKYLKNQDEYSKWARMDSSMKKSFTGTDATVGFTSSWEGNSKVGKGEQEIKKITEGKKIDYELRFEKPMKDVAAAVMSTDSMGPNQTMVKWSINGKMKYPMNVMGLVMNKMLGGDLEIGLTNLKAKMEAK